MPTITEILKFLHKAKGFNYPAYHIEMLERRINNRIVKTNTKNIAGYYDLLTTREEEPDQLIGNFMINVSHFFRDPLSFEILAKIIIPDLIAVKQLRHDDALRIWSAGCSYGEEAYSLAILLKEYMEHEKINLNIDFFATDFNAEAIKNDQLGIYSTESIKEVKHGFIDKYFTKSAGKYAIKPELKAMVKFSVYDLLDAHSYAPSDSVFGDFDLILCRNVLIYFNLEFQGLILNKLYKSLASKGILVLGETETPVGQFKAKFRQTSGYCKIFEKR